MVLHMLARRLQAAQQHGQVGGVAVSCEALCQGLCAAIGSVVQ